MTLSPNEAYAIELLRQLKANKGHGVLRIDVRDGLESLFRPESALQPPDRRPPAR